MGSISKAMLALAVGAAVVGGCAQKRAQPTARSAAPTTAPAPTLPAQEDPPQGSNNTNEKQPRFGDAVAYVDGKPLGVLRIKELPSSLKVHVTDLGDGYQSKHYRLFEYARAVGIDTKRLKAMHLYGGVHISVVDRAELDRIGEKIAFSFSGGDRGKPRVEWPPVKLNVNTTIDMLSNVVFYLEKAPPVLNKDGVLAYPDGKLVEEKVPYASDEQGNGTRIYIDGALVGTVKRKKLGGDIASDADASKFSLLAYAAKLSPAAKSAKTIDLVAGDDVVGRLDAKDTTFVVPPKNRGQAVVDVPTTDGSEAARVSAVQIFVRSAPPARTLTKISDAPDARPSASERSGSGSDDEL
jgi:hypothetical protein